MEIILIIIIALLVYRILKNTDEIAKLKEVKFELRKGENLKPCTMRFKEGFQITRTSNGEPIDEITVVEYSNLGECNHVNKG